MIVVKKSGCCCGKCGGHFEVEWELELVNTSERNMGEENEYIGEIEQECPNCGNEIYATLEVWEYPVGAVEMTRIKDVSDSMNTAQTEIKEPDVYFYDL